MFFARLALLLVAVFHVQAQPEQDCIASTGQECFDSSLDTSSLLQRSSTSKHSKVIEKDWCEGNCFCFVWRDSNFCNTCPGYGGRDCGPCDTYCTGGLDFQACEEDPAGCECAAHRDPNFCNTNPPLCQGYCSSLLQQSSVGEHMGNPSQLSQKEGQASSQLPPPWVGKHSKVSEQDWCEGNCFCFVRRDSNFCNTCPGYGGRDCGPCDTYCTGGLDFQACEEDPAGCECAAHRDPNFCNANPPLCQGYCSSLLQQSSVGNHMGNRSQLSEKEGLASSQLQSSSIGKHSKVSEKDWCEGNCFCFVRRDSNFCNTCPGYGGRDCGPCDTYCTGGLDFQACEEDPAGCECAAHRDPNFCNTNPPLCQGYCSSLLQQSSIGK